MRIILCLGHLFCQVMYLSKMTTAILDDLDYIVDASAVSSQDNIGSGGLFVLSPSQLLRLLSQEYSYRQQRSMV